jgi:C-terminal processing protease CtpA/Prc
VGAMILTPSTIFSVFVLRSLVQQILHNKEYKKLNNSIRSFLEKRAKEAQNRKEIQEQIEEMWKESMDKTTQDMMKRRNDNINTNIDKIKLEDLNWKKNPSIEQ